MAVSEKVSEVIRRPRAAHVVRPATGLWAWLLQRVTAALIFIALGAHIWVLHYDKAGDEITYQTVLHRFGSPWLVTMDVALLVTGIYHALNGLRAVIFDFGLSAKAQRTVTWALAVVGVLALLFGINALMAFLRGNALLW
jgi:succinate dehydrogenase / fumarate reductase membrane anchor subunit